MATKAEAIKYLVKANNELVSHCDCKTAYITYPPQMDCPWCGCGWLFTCTKCRKAFTFARCIDVNESWEELAMHDLQEWSSRGHPATKEDIASWISSMKVLLRDVEVGREYVAFDGWFLPADSEGVAIEGWHALHDLPFVPQVEALRDSTVIDSILSNPEYWNERRIERDDDE